VLAKFDGVRPTRDGWDARCPVPNHNRDGDQHASLRIAISDDGRILLKCRVGCPTDEVLAATALDWSDLFPSSDPQPDEEAVVPPPAAARIDKADADLCASAYQALLANLSLIEDHRTNLRQRGLPDAEIDRRGYRSLRNTERGRAAKAVHQLLGDAVLGVPGFVRGAFGMTLQGEATGLLVPVRDLQGLVQAIKVRRDQEPKYLYLSSGGDGPSPGSPVHIPLGVVAPAPVVRVVEGELKADVTCALDSTPTIGVPGVTQWRPALSVLRELGATTVILAYDAPDVHTKPPVFLQMEELWQALRADGFEVEVEDWHDQLQGA
jgi:hypothetical protein